MVKYCIKNLQEEFRREDLMVEDSLLMLEIWEK